MHSILRRIVPLLLAASSACLDTSQDQLLAVVQNGKYGYIDHLGQIVIQPQFIWANDFWRGLGTVYVCGHYVSIDSSGIIVPLRIAAPGQLQPRADGDRFGFVDEAGRFRIKPTFDEVLPFSDGLAAVKIDERWGFIDTRGAQIISPQFTAAFYFREGVGFADLDRSPVLIDRSGQVLASGYTFLTGIVSHRRVPAERDGKGGYLDLQGHVVIPLIYDSVWTFSNGLAAVEKAGKWGYIDVSGRVIIPLEFDEAGQFGSGLAAVRMGTRSGFINKSGRFAFDLPFDFSAPGFITGDEESNTLVADSDVSRFWTRDDKFGYVNTSGRVIWGPIDGSPDHGPLLGWTDEMKAESCQGISASTRAAITRLFPG